MFDLIMLICDAELSGCVEIQYPDVFVGTFYECTKFIEDVAEILVRVEGFQAAIGKCVTAGVKL